MVLVGGVLSVAAYYGRRVWTSSSDTTGTTLTATVDKSDLYIIVTERGELESVKTENGVCEVEGHQNKIIFITPEGSKVKKDDIVVRFDTAEIDKNIAKQKVTVNQAKVKIQTTEQELEIQRNKGTSEIAEADLELKLAKLDFDKYEQGEFEVEKSDFNGRISLAKANLEASNDAFANFKKLVKKGFRTPQQLRQKEQEVEEAKFNLQRDERKLDVLMDFDHERMTTEYASKAKQAISKLARAKASAEAENLKARSEYEAAVAEAKLEEQQLEKYEKQLAKCTIPAKQDGVVAYANKDWWDASRQIREGAMVYFRQVVFTLPDMSQMQVKVNVHESVVKKVAVGQKAEVRIDAFANIPLVGTVTKVSPLADSTRSWSRGGVKEYTTIVTIDEMPEEDLRPGMTAEVKILVGELHDVLVVPVQAVTEHDHNHYAYVRGEAGFDRYDVKLGESNRKHVEVLEGLAIGQLVALDARSRALDEFKDKPTSDGKPPGWKEDKDTVADKKTVEAKKTVAGKETDKGKTTVKAEDKKKDKSKGEAKEPASVEVAPAAG